MDVNQENAKYNQQAQRSHNLGETPTPAPQDAYCGVEQASTSNRGRPSQAEEAERNSRYHRMEADRADLASRFFRKHPEFDEFIQLIRGAVIHL